MSRLKRDVEATYKANVYTGIYDKQPLDVERTDIEQVMGREAAAPPPMSPDQYLTIQNWAKEQVKAVEEERQVFKNISVRNAKQFLSKQAKIVGQSEEERAGDLSKIKPKIKSVVTNYTEETDELAAKYVADLLSRETLEGLRAVLTNILGVPRISEDGTKVFEEALLPPEALLHRIGIERSRVTQDMKVSNDELYEMGYTPALKSNGAGYLDIDVILSGASEERQEQRDRVPQEQFDNSRSVQLSKEMGDLRGLEAEVQKYLSKTDFDDEPWAGEEDDVALLD